MQDDYADLFLFVFSTGNVCSEMSDTEFIVAPKQRQSKQSEYQK